MPELPEVETVLRGLSPKITGLAIKDVLVRRGDLRVPVPESFPKALEGAKIEQLKRKSKYLLAFLDNNMVWVTHLGMSGRLLLLDERPKEYKKHDHIMIEFENGPAIVFNDTRRFGLMIIIPKVELESHPMFIHLGPEPMEKDFNPEYLMSVLKGRKAPIKHLLMDARVVVGVGNIYASESLFRSGIKPTRPGGKIKREEVSILVNNIRDVLGDAIKSGGSTLRDYVRSSGDMGYFQHKFSVYDRKDQPCHKCNKPIKRLVQQGRASYYCPNCQL